MIASTSNASSTVADHAIATNPNLNNIEIPTGEDQCSGNSAADKNSKNGNASPKAQHFCFNHSVYVLSGAIILASLIVGVSLAVSNNNDDDDDDDNKDESPFASQWYFDEQGVLMDRASSTVRASATSLQDCLKHCEDAGAAAGSFYSNRNSCVCAVSNDFCFTELEEPYGAFVQGVTFSKISKMEQNTCSHTFCHYYSCPMKTPAPVQVAKPAPPSIASLPPMVNATEAFPYAWDFQDGVPATDEKYWTSAFAESFDHCIRLCYSWKTAGIYFEQTGVLPDWPDDNCFCASSDIDCFVEITPFDKVTNSIANATGTAFSSIPLATCPKTFCEVLGGLCE